MEKEKRIAELEETKRRADIEIAFWNDKKIEAIILGGNSWFVKGESTEFEWGRFDYRIAEEPRRMPFDGSDAFNLVLQKFKNIYDNEDNFPDIFVCTKAGEYSVTLEMDVIGYEDLSKYWLKWNDTLKEWQPCNKVA